MKTIHSFLVLLSLGLLPCSAQQPNAATFSLLPADVPKVVILMFVGGKTTLEVTYTPQKQAEFAMIAARNVGKPINIVLDGKIVAQRTLTSPTVGHSIKVDEPSPEAAFAVARELLKRGP
jgi:hypothetical protein